jgi:hypothetical protein
MIVYYHFEYLPPTPPVPPVPPADLGEAETKVKFYTWAQLGTPSLVFAAPPRDTTYITVTTGGRELFVRSVVEGLAFQIQEFAVGTDGFTPSDPGQLFPVNTNATELGNEVARAPINLVNPLPNGSVEYYCRLGTGVMPAHTLTLGEIGLFATITHSPLAPAEVGTQVLFAIAHEPMQVNTRNRVLMKKLTLEL